MNKNKIRQLAVKISNHIGVHIGSGTLFVPKSDGKYAYIFTAAHVAVEGIDAKKLKFKMLLDEEEKDFETNDEDSIKLHEGFDKNVDQKKCDIAIVRINKEDWMCELPTLTIGLTRENDVVQGQGFPISAHESRFLFSMIKLEGEVITCSYRYKRFQVKLTNSLDLSNRDSELKGYSGSGLYDIRDEELILVGIFSYGQGEHAIQNITNSFCSDLIIDICKKYGWEEPERAFQVPCSFQPYVYESFRLIENDKVKRQSNDIIEYIINKGYNPSNLVSNSDDIYDIPKCNSRDRVRCKECWIARIQLICVLIFLGVNIDSLKKPSVLIDDKLSTPIEFICSEGTKGDGQLKKVIHSIYENGFLYNEKFRNNAILVWASKGKQTHKIMNRTRFNRVIGDISNEPINKIRKFDTLYGDGKKNNLSIIPIDKLIESIDVEEDEDVNSNLMGVLKDAIR